MKEDPLLKRVMMIVVIIAISLVIFSDSASAAFYIFGFVRNATDGEDANGYTVMIWKTSAGRSDNLTDIIGPGGLYNEEPNYFVLDCEALADPCNIGDNFSVEIMEENNYSAGPVSLIVNGPGLVQAPNMTLTLNKAPYVKINRPLNGTNNSDTVRINATAYNTTAFPMDKVIYKIGNATGNYSGTKVLNSFSYMARIGTTIYYNASFNASMFSRGWYTLFVVGNNTKGMSNTSQIQIYLNTSIDKPDLEITSANIQVTTINPYEAQNITITATVKNIGTANAVNVKVQFFEGNYSLNRQIGVNHTVNINKGANASVVEYWVAKQGTTHLYVVVDPPIGTGTIVELLETNNFAFKEVVVYGYHTLYGNVSGNLTLEDSSGSALKKWLVSDALGSNIYVAATGSVIDFSALKALSRNTTSGYVSNDFVDVDFLLNTTNLTDSVNRTYTFNGNPKWRVNFSVNGIAVLDVPVVNSTNTSNFLTGIMWDTSDSVGDGQYDITDKEDLIFATKVNPNAQGKYGLYDYEIAVLANLRKYKSPGQTVDLYLEIR